MQNKIVNHLQLHDKKVKIGHPPISKAIIVYVIFISILYLGNDGFAKEEMNIFDKMGVIRLEQTFDAPLFSLANIDGNIESLSNYRGKIVMLNFWATW